MQNNSTSTRQHGAALTITLIMLVLLTMLVLSAVAMSTVNLRVVANEQVRAQSVGSAQQAIEQVISTDFASNPQPVSIGVDVDQDGLPDYNVAVSKPVCLNAVPIKEIELDVSSAADVACFASATTPGTGPAGARSGDSLCSNTQWDVAATATPVTKTGSTVTVHQGVGGRVTVGSTC